MPPHEDKHLGEHENLPALQMPVDSPADCDCDCDSSELDDIGYEGPEKRLEIDFSLVSRDRSDWSAMPSGELELASDLRRLLTAADIQEILDLACCTIVSTTSTIDCTAYVLSESSLFVFPRKLMLKTCGTTTLLATIPRVLELARSAALGSAPDAAQFYLYPSLVMYSRKNFIFPARQKGPHKNWQDEVSVLEDLFPMGDAFSMGPLTGEHWLMFLARPTACVTASLLDAPIKDLVTGTCNGVQLKPHPSHFTSSMKCEVTMEVMMRHLDPEVTREFYRERHENRDSAHQLINDLFGECGIHVCYDDDGNAPTHTKNGVSVVTDEYHFEPCGYSMNGLFPCNVHEHSPRPSPADHAENYNFNNVDDCGSGYCTIHVTPEDHCSYASFEVSLSLPVPSDDPGGELDTLLAEAVRAPMATLAKRVLALFNPRLATIALFCESPERSAVVARAVDDFSSKLHAEGLPHRVKFSSQSIVNVNSNTAQKGFTGQDDCRLFLMNLQQD